MMGMGFGEGREGSEMVSIWELVHGSVPPGSCSTGLIIGTLNVKTNCGGRGCFTLSDGRATVCCALLHLDDNNLSNLIGNLIHVHSWNFIPLSKSGISTITSGGAAFLEIISWNLAADEHPPHEEEEEEDGDHGRRVVVGRLECVSPVTVVPCTLQNHQTNLTGFLVQLLPLNNHRHPLLTLYCFASALSWHPLLCMLLGKVVCISGLKKKSVFIGKQDSRLMFTTTPAATLSYPPHRHRHRHPHSLSPPPLLPKIEGQGESAAYCGFVTGVHMQGMLVELDHNVYLVLTHHLLAPPHFLRLGALISLTNVHFLRPNFSWTTTTILLLGACFNTTINVKSFSPFHSPSTLPSKTPTSLATFTHSLHFSARFWFLLTISSFKKIFHTFFSPNHILGSKRKPGVAQLYATSTLPSSLFRPHPAAGGSVLTEFCNHHLSASACATQPDYTPHPNLPIPISTFLNHSHLLWLNYLLQLQKNHPNFTSPKQYPLSCANKSVSNPPFIRRIISSSHLGLVLIGFLKVSSSSGRLRLLDSSATIDVVIPDMPSHLHASNIYQVRYYNIVIEGLPAKLEAPQLPNTNSFSFKTLFNQDPPNTHINPSTIYLHFYMRDATCLNSCLRLPSLHSTHNLMEIASGMFHLLLVTHKFPPMQNFQGDSISSNKSSFFVEAVIFSWSLFIPENHTHTLMTQLSTETKNEHLEYAHGKTFLENFSRKRLKVAHGSSRALISSTKENLEEAGNKPRGYKSNLPHEFPCLVHVRDFNTHTLTRPGVLLRDDHGVTDDVVGKPSDKKILLEFKFEAYNNYALLRVGEYYLMEYANKELRQTVKDRHHHVIPGKTFVTPETPLWSLTFSCDEVLSPNGLSQNYLLHTFSTGNGTVPSECSPTSEIFFQKSPSQSSGTCSHDINLHLSINAMNLLKASMKGLEDELIKPAFLSKVTGIIYTCSGTGMGASLFSSGIADPDCNRLPHGSLVSVRGDVVDIHSLNCYSDITTHASYEGVSDIHWMRFSHGLPMNICIHLSSDYGIVRLHGTLSKHGYPVGMGPGVNATFRRVLVIGQLELMLIPASFIVINSIKDVFQDYGEMSSNPEIGSGILNDLDKVSAVISEFVQCLRSKPLRFCCRIVAIHVLMLEKQITETENVQFGKQSMIPVVDIPLAGFILDDGSSSCCCWAGAERAATLLRLHEETIFKAYHSSRWRRKKGKPDKYQRTAYYHLSRILKKHRRIIVKNQGSMLDSTGQDLVFSVDSDNVFSRSDENLLKLIIINACCSSAFSIVGNAMDSNATAQLEKDLSGLDMRTESMQNVWVTEVLSVNHLAEARSLIQQLV